MPSAPGYRLALDTATVAAREAGAFLRGEFHKPGGPGHADEQSERLIRSRLLAAFPAWSYLGEETGRQTGSDPSHVWVVDPDDGTSEYEKGRRGSAVSIAVLRDGQPVLGVVYSSLYPDDEGDLIAWAEGCGEILRNGRPVSPLADADLDDFTLPFHNRLVVFLSPPADTVPELNAVAVGPARYRTLPSIAYRLALVACGEGVGTVSISGTGPVSWDFAAGHALLRAAGGVLVDLQGTEVRYDRDGRSAPGYVFGGGKRAAEALRKRDWAAVLKADRPTPGPWGLLAPQRGRSTSDVAVLRRAQGCLLGQLCGDALGGLVEFRTPEEIQARYPGGVRDLADGGTWGNLAGQPTDDSEMALMLARTLVARGTYDRGAVLDAYCHWWLRAWDHGGTLRRALDPACMGQTTAERLALAEKNANRARASNGSLMRISPVGIFAAGQPGLAARIARTDSALTHPSPVSCDACAAYCAAVATAVASGDRQAAYAAALNEASHPDVRRVVEEAATRKPASFTHPDMGLVVIALQNALYQLVHAPDLEEALADTIAQGGDTDTTGAIAGALVGAVLGREAVPPRWLRTLLCCRPMQGSPTAHPQPAEFWPADALELAEALLVVGRRAGG